MNIAKVQFGGLLLLIALGASIVFGLYNQLISWHKDDYLCYGGKRFYNGGDKLVIASVGSLQVKYQPMQWGCPEERRYDGEKYQVINGELVPR